MKHALNVARALFLTGIVALVAAGLISSRGPRRPDASGEVGLLKVFGQQPAGPVRLRPGHLHSLPRPQDLAFSFTADGTGPRLVRIEVETSDGRRYTAYEHMHYAPARDESLRFVLELSEETPDRADVWATIEAPHTSPVLSRFPLRLTGRARRFWEAEP